MVPGSCCIVEHEGHMTDYIDCMHTACIHPSEQLTECLQLRVALIVRYLKRQPASAACSKLRSP
jgi:hypothetical protein